MYIKILYSINTYIIIQKDQNALSFCLSLKLFLEVLDSLNNRQSQ